MSCLLSRLSGRRPIISVIVRKVGEEVIVSLTEKVGVIVEGRMMLVVERVRHVNMVGDQIFVTAVAAVEAVVELALHVLFRQRRVYLKASLRHSWCNASPIARSLQLSRRCGEIATEVVLEEVASVRKEARYMLITATRDVEVHVDIFAIVLAAYVCIVPTSSTHGCATGLLQEVVGRRLAVQERASTDEGVAVASASVALGTERRLSESVEVAPAFRHHRRSCRVVVFVDAETWQAMLAINLKIVKR